jgi:hypothetical protein
VYLVSAAHSFRHCGCRLITLYSTASANMRCQLLASSSRKPFACPHGATRNTHINRTVVAARAEAAEVSEAPDAAAHKSASEWYAHMKAEFGPVSSAPPTTAVLDFEKPLVELDRRIREVRSIVDPIRRAERVASLLCSPRAVVVENTRFSLL